MPHLSITFDHFFQQSPIGLVAIDAQEKTIHPNPAFCRLLGYEETELQNAGLKPVIHPDDWEPFLQAQSQAERNPGANVELELRFIRKNNTTDWMRITYTKLWNDANSPNVTPVTSIISVENISELKAVKNTLKISEERIKRVVEAASIGLYDWNVQTRESYWNDKNYELLNIPKDSSQTPNFDSVLAQLPEQDRIAARERMQTVLEQGGTYEYDYPIPLGDGSVRYVHSRGKVTQWDEEGNALIVSGVLTDITALKRAQEKAIQARARLNKVLEANLIGMLICKKDGSILEANRAFLDLLGYSRTELEAGLLNWRTLTPPDYQHVNDRNERIIAATGVMPISEKQYFHKDGHRVDVILAVAMFEDDPETGVGFILDNTQRKQHERNLQEREESWRFLANFLPQMVWMADTQGSRYWFNQRWFEFTGTTLEEVEGSKWQKLVHPDHLPRVIAGIQEAWSREEAWEDSYLIMGKDHQYVWFLGRAIPVRDNSGKVVRWLGTSTDISELHDTQEALLHSQRQLQASNRDLEQFASIASHDLQAPLRKAKSFCELIYASSRDKLDDTTLDLMKRAKDSLDNMQTLVADLLELSKISQEPEHFELVDLNQPLQQALINLSDTIQDSGAQINFAKLHQVYGDSGQLTQLLQNLIQNALKYQPMGQRPVITIQSGCDDHYCQISITDNGIGFAQEYAERIFKPFERLHGKSSVYKGTGIGLAICQRIVERHHGTIEAEGIPQQGATFTIRIPLQVPLQARISAERARWQSTPRYAPLHC